MKAHGLSFLPGIAVLAGCTTLTSTSEVDLMKQKLAAAMKTHQVERANLENFDDLDFNVYSGQKWDQLEKSHSRSIVVHYAPLRKQQRVAKCTLPGGGRSFSFSFGS